MPEDTKENEITHYLKAISMFDPEKDFKTGDDENRRNLSMVFRKLIMSDDPQAIEFFTRFLAGVDKVIKDMGLVDKTALDTASDEVEMPPEDNTDDLDLGGGRDEDPKAPKTDIGPGGPPMSDGYNYLLDMANSYIYM